MKEVENQVLAAVLADPSVLSDLTMISQHDFTGVNSKIYNAFLYLDSKGEHINPTSVAVAAGVDYSVTAALLTTEPSADSAVSGANLLAKARKITELSQIGRDLVMNATLSTDLEASIDSAVSRLLDLTINASAGSMVSLDQAFHSSVAASQALMLGQESLVKTGFAGIDQILAMMPGDLVLLAARPSVGKSALSMNIATNVAQAGKRVLVFNLEMSLHQLTTRIIAGYGEVAASRMLRGSVSSQEIGRMINICADNVEWAQRVRILDQSGLSPAVLRGHLRREQRKGEIGLVVVDYIQLMRSGEKTQNANAEVSAISRSLKCLAKDFSVPILALSQLSRDIERRSNPRPMLSDLRDSGSLEQDADAVVFIERPDKGEQAEIIVAKQRNGPLGSAFLRFDQGAVRFH